MINFQVVVVLLSVLLGIARPAGVSDPPLPRPLRLTAIGQEGGVVLDVAIQSKLAYVGFGPRLKVFDISNPDRPVLLGQSSPLPGVIQEVEVSGNYAYVSSCGTGDPSLFMILNIQDLSEIKRVGAVSFTGCSHTSFIVLDGYTYFPYNNKLIVIDIRNPSRPVQVNSVTLTTGTLRDITRVGAYLYSASTSGTLLVIDIAQPTAPAVVASVPAYWEHSGVKISVHESYLYAVDLNTLYIYDIHELIQPTLVSFSRLFTHAQDITASDDYVAVSEALGVNGLSIIDVKDKLSPVVAGYLEMDFGGMKIEGVDTQVFTANNGGGFRIVDVTDIQNPHEVGRYDTVPLLWNLAVKDGYAYAGDQFGALSILDIRSNAPRQIGLYQPLPETDQEIYTCPKGGWLFGDITLYDLTVSGYYVYAASGVNGLQVFSVVDPSNPTIIGNLDTQGSAFGVAISGYLAYLADGCHGLRVIDIRNPNYPVEVGSFIGIREAMAVAVADHYAYVTEWSNGLFVLDIQNPAAPVLVLQLPTAGAWDVQVVGQYLFLPTLQNFQIYDLSNPAAPVLLGELDEFGYFLAIDGETAYLTSQSGIKAIDIRDPRHPILVDQHPSPGLARGIAAKNGNNYIADGDGGLYIMKLTDKLSFMPLHFR